MIKSWQQGEQQTVESSTTEPTGVKEPETDAITPVVTPSTPVDANVFENEPSPDSSVGEEYK